MRSRHSMKKKRSRRKHEEPPEILSVINDHPAQRVVLFYGTSVFID